MQQLQMPDSVVRSGPWWSGYQPTPRCGMAQNPIQYTVHPILFLDFHL
jgi:hypothetical protein